MNLKWPGTRKLSEWRVKQFELKLREKDAKKGKYIWFSRGSNGVGLTYVKSEQKGFKHGA